jgi:hypothetical protein
MPYTFFVNYRKRYNLDNVLKHWEKDNGPLPEDNADVKVELDDSNTDNDVICIFRLTILFQIKQNFTLQNQLFILRLRVTECIKKFKTITFYARAR